MTLSWNNTNNTITWGTEVISGDYIFHIDSTNGNDTTGDGSEGNPWATQKKSTDYIVQNSLSTETSLVVVHPGNYTSYYHGTLTEVGFSDVLSGSKVPNSRNIIYAGHPNETFINVSGGSGRDLVCVQQTKDGSKVIGIVFDYDYGSRVNIYQRQIFKAGDGFSSNNENILKGEVRNCHFILRKASGFSSANNSNTLHCYNCSFDAKTGTYEQDWSGQTSMTNGVFTGTVPTSVNGLTFPNNSGLLTTSYDVDYYPVGSAWEDTGFGTDQGSSIANYGVYGGLYGWENVIENPSFVGRDNGKFINDRFDSTYPTSGHFIVQTISLDENGNVSDLGNTQVEKWLSNDKNSLFYKDA